MDAAIAGQQQSNEESEELLRMEHDRELARLGTEHDVAIARVDQLRIDAQGKVLRLQGLLRSMVENHPYSQKILTTLYNMDGPQA